MCWSRCESMNITKQSIKEIVKYIPSVIPLAAVPFFPDMSPEVLAIFGASIQNCIEIIRKTPEFMDDEVDIRDIDVDWRANYFDKCRIVHDDDMQTLWAKILAEEANKPGTYSKRTVNFVAEMDKKEAELFTCLCGFVCEIKPMTNDIDFMPLLFSYDFFNYRMHDEDLNHLDTIGLIRLDDPPGDIILHKPIEVSYYEESIHLGLYLKSDKEIPDSLKFLPASHIKLTQIGKELYPISGSIKVDGLLDYVCSELWRPFTATKITEV